uniref:Centromere/kinetochore protein zw10 homolog n=1 Tax=Syphacia muris TaxID=451379 RepID=A0A0N5ACE3_9BILA
MENLSVVQLMNGDVDTSLKDISRTVLLLQSEIANALAGISQMVKMKYSECVPTLCATTALLEKLRATNKNLKQVEKSLSDIVGSFQEDINEEDKAIFTRAEELKECLKKLSLIEQIEEDLSALWCSNVKETPLSYAKFVAAVKLHLSNLYEGHGDIDETVAEKILPLLKQEYITHNENAIHELNVYWDSVFSFSNQSDEFVMKIISENKQEFEERLQAMNVLGSLDGRLTKLSRSILNNFCFRIIHDPNISLSFNPTVGLTRAASQYIVKTISTPSNHSRIQIPDMENVFDLLTKFFTALFVDLGAVKVSDTHFINMLCAKMSDDFMSALLQDCIAKNISVDCDNDDASFEHMKSLVLGFLQFLEEKDFIKSAEQCYDKVVKQLDVVFNNRHCTKIIVNARTIISSPYLELETVGYGQVDERETINELKAECDQIKVRGASRENFPRLLRFAKCQVRYY